MPFFDFISGDFSSRRTPFDPVQGKQGFTLIELLIVIGIVGILSLVVILVISPIELLRQARDTTRLSDMDTLNHALNLYQVDVSVNTSLGNASTTYFSLVDTTATSTTGTNCANVGFSPPVNWTYHCAASSTVRNVDGTGWVPVNFTSMSFGSPLGALPIDPTNTTSSNMYYTYTPGGSWKITSFFESRKQAKAMANDGGTDPALYEVGSNLAIQNLGRGLVGYWTFDEASGVLLDSSGYGNNGTQSGGVAYGAAGKVGNALSFDGVNDYVNAPSPGMSAVSAFAWYKGADGTIFRMDNDNYGIRVDPSPGSIERWHINAWNSLAINQNVSNDAVAWHYIGLTYNGTTLTAYFDGLAVATVNGSFSIGSGTLKIGTRSDAFSEFFTGTIDDVRVYNRALSTAEIAAIYNATK